MTANALNASGIDIQEFIVVWIEGTPPTSATKSSGSKLAIAASSIRTTFSTHVKPGWNQSCIIHLVIHGYDSKYVVMGKYMVLLRQLLPSP
jgi:hypothetical protein